MRARIVGGALAWVVSLAPLVVVNLIAYLGVFTLDEAAVIGAVALVAGVALGALTAGLFGGRARDLSADAAEALGRAPVLAQRIPNAPNAPNATSASRLGASGALATGGIAATLYALTMIGLILLAGSLNILPNIVTQHPIRITAAILCVAAVFLGLAMLVGWLATRGDAADDVEAAPTPAGGRMAATPASRGPGAASRSLTSSMPARGAAARATRPLTAAEYGAPGGFGVPGAYTGQDDYGEYGERSAYGDQPAYGAYARPAQTASRPGERRDPRAPTPAPANRARDAYDQRIPYDQPDPRDEYRRRAADDDYNNENGGDGYGRRAADDIHGARTGAELDAFDGYQRPRDARDTRPRGQRDDGRGGQRDGRDGYAADATNDDDADDWRRGDGQPRDSRAGSRRPARRDDRYER